MAVKDIFTNLLKVVGNMQLTPNKYLNKEPLPPPCMAASQHKQFKQPPYEGNPLPGMPFQIHQPGNGIL